MSLPLHRSDEEKRLTPRTSPKFEKRRFTILVILATLLGVVYFLFVTPTTTSKSSYPRKGWHQRAHRPPRQPLFDPETADLLFGFVRSTPVIPDALTAAFFAPDIVVDAMGRVLQLEQSDLTALTNLVRRSTGGAIPLPGGWRNQWRVKHETTSYPVDWLRAVVPGGARDVSVYGFDFEIDELDPPVAGLSHLPVVLKSTFASLNEGRDDFRSGFEDADMIGKVTKRILEAKTREAVEEESQVS